MNWIRTNTDLQPNDIIKYRVRNEWVYSKIVYITNTTLKVINLDLIPTENRDSFIFRENDSINPITKNSLSNNNPSRYRATYKLWSV
jgi:hypothetical protein